MTHRARVWFFVGALLVALLGYSGVVLAQGQSLQRLDDRCTVSVLNRNIRVNPDGSWVLPNVPANFGPVRARATCVIDGQTISGESEPFTLSPNGVVNIPRIIFGQSTPIPIALTVTAPAAQITQLGGTLQLTVTATYSNGSSANVTAAGTQYSVSNAAIATISPTGLVTAVKSGTVLIQATKEGRSGIIAITVVVAGNDRDGDGIPDDVEVALGLNPDNKIDALEDFDRDGLTNLQEVQAGTEIRKADTDSDGLKDGDELARKTSPLIADTDGDGVRDGLEVQTGSSPLDPLSINLAGALSSIAVTPGQFVLTYNTILGEASRLLSVVGNLRDGSTINLTSRARGTNYSSNDLNVCNFGVTDGAVYAGVTGACSVTVSNNGFTASAAGTVVTFSPTARSFMSLDGVGAGLDVSGDFVFVAVGASGLEVVNVSNRAAPFKVTLLAGLGATTDVKVVGPRAYVSSNAGLFVLDIANPLLPRLLGSVALNGSPQDLVVRGSRAYVASSFGGLQLVDVSQDASPRAISSVPMGDARGVDVVGNVAVVTDSNSLRVVDVTVPTAPVLRGSVNLFGDIAYDVVLNAAATHAFVANGNSSMRVVDISNRNSPVAGAVTDTSLGGMLSDIAYVAPFVFGADYFFVNGVPIVDVGNPANPVPRAILDFRQFNDDNGLGVVADAAFVYMTSTAGRLFIGEYRIADDTKGIPPNVSISSPASGASFVEGQNIGVTVVASDDVGVTAVTLVADGKIVSVDTTAPYQFNVAAVFATGTMVFSAIAADAGGNIAVSTDLAVTVTPGLGHIWGRVTNSATNAGVANATVRIYNAAGVQVTQTPTNGNGDYTSIGLSAGNYFAIASLGGFVSIAYPNVPCLGCAPASGLAIAVANGNSAANINFALVPFGAVSGTITKASDGLPLGINVSAGLYDPAGQFLQSTGLNQQGGYSFTGLIPGTYYVRTFNNLGYINQIFGGPSPADCCSTSQGTPVIVPAGATRTGVDFALTLGGRISGRVVSAADNTAVGNAWLAMYDLSGAYVMGGSVDGSGNYTTYGGMPAGQYYVRTYNQRGFFNQLYQANDCLGCDVTKGAPVAVVVGSTTPSIDFALTPGGGLVRGTVRDAATGAVIPNVNMNFYALDGRFLVGSNSDSQGRYVLDGGLPAGDYVSRTFNSSGFVNELFDDIACLGCDVKLGTPIQVQASTEKTLDVALSRGGTMSGLITDSATGVGIANVNVSVLDTTGRNVTNGTTNAVGRYVTNNGLPSGSYYVQTTNAQGYFNQLFNGIECVNCVITSGAAVAVVAGEVTEDIDFALRRGTRIFGKITDAATGEGLSGASVNIYTTGGVFLVGGSTNAVGDYTIGSALQPGLYLARTFNNRGYMNQLFDGIPCFGCSVLTGTPITVAPAGDTVLNFSLAIGGRISGRVTDAAGVPLSGITVQVFNAAGSFQTNLTTDAQGRYITTEGLLTGNYYVRTFNTLGWANELYRERACLGCSVTMGDPVGVAVGQVTPDIDFTLVRVPGAYVNGHVRSAATGDGIPNVSINFYDANGAFVTSGFSSSSSVDRGAYKTNDILPAGTYFARTFSSAGYAPELYRDLPCVVCSVTTGTPIQVIDAVDTLGIDFTLTLGGQFSGRVTSTSGVGLSGVTVQVNTTLGAGVTSASTDSNGRYVTSGIEPGSYLIRTSNLQGFVDEAYLDIPCPGCSSSTGTPVQAVAGAQTTIDFALAIGGRIGGRVTDAISGQGLSGVRVDVLTLTGTFVTNVNTDSNGNYVTGKAMVQGLYLVRTVNAAGHVDGLYQGLSCTNCNVTTGTPVAVVEGVVTPSIDFTLAPAGQISGVVRDAATQQPLAGVNVQLSTSTGTGIKSANTDAAGAYTLANIPAGTYVARTNNSLGYVNVLYNGIECVNCNITTGSPIQVAAGQTTSGLDFNLPIGVKLSGVVSTAAGAASGITVQAYNAATGVFVASASSNTAGTYTLSLPAGTYFARTTNSTGLIDQIFSSVSTIECAPNYCLGQGTPLVWDAGSAPALNFTLAAGGGASGLVREADSGQPVSGVFVQFVDSDGRTAVTAVTGSDGRYQRTGLPAGNYFLRTQETAGPHIDRFFGGSECVGTICSFAGASPVSVNSSGTTTGVDFDLRTGGRFSGLVTNGLTGQPLPNVSVDILSVAGGTVGQAFSNADGLYTTRTFPAGSYFVKTNNNDGFINRFSDGSECNGFCGINTGTAPLLTIQDGQTSAVNLALRPGARISGRVTDAATGNGFVALVSVTDAAGRAVTGGGSDAAGNYITADALLPGTYFARTTNNLGYVDERYDDRGCTTCPPTMGTPIVVADDLTPDINFVLAPGARVRGLVTSATGRPMSGVTVQVLDSVGHQLAAAATNAFGIYTTTTGLPAGQYYLRAPATFGLISEAYQDVVCQGVCSLRDATSFAVNGSGISTAPEIGLGPGAILTGAVTDDNGAPRPFVTVGVVDASGLLLTSTLSDSQGRYRTTTGLPNGTYYARTFAVNAVNEARGGTVCLDTCNVSLSTPIVVASATPISGLDFALSGGGSISGTVRDGTGSPLPGVLVRGYEATGKPSGSGFSAADGTYRLLSGALPAGSYFVRTANALGFVDELFGGIACPTECDVTTGSAVAVVAGATTPNVDFTLANVAAPPMAAPHTQSPSGASSASPTFTWAALPGALAYVLSVDDASQAERVLSELTLNEAHCAVVGGSQTCTVTLPFPLAQGAGRWRVAAITGAGLGEWSAYSNFVVGGSVRLEQAPASIEALVQPVTLRASLGEPPSAR